MSGQSLTEMLMWHPRDVDTLIEIYETRAAEREQQQQDERFAAATADLKRRLNRG